MVDQIVAQQPLIRVLLVDDEEIVRYGLNAILQADAGLVVVGEAQDGRGAIAQAKALQPDIVLMDINMPVLDGIGATKEIYQALPSTKVLMLTTHEDDEYLVNAMQEGAAGYLLKNTPPEDFSRIIQSAYRGYLQIGPSLGQKLCGQLLPLTSKKTPAWPMTINRAGITPREKEVLALIAEGASNREISQILHIAEKTVKNHVSSMLRRVGCRDRTQLAIWANTVEGATQNSANAEAS